MLSEYKTVYTGGEAEIVEKNQDLLHLFSQSAQRMRRWSLLRK